MSLAPASIELAAMSATISAIVACITFIDVFSHIRACCVKCPSYDTIL
jgi:hypothetical protein